MDDNAVAWFGVNVSADKEWCLWSFCCSLVTGVPEADRVGQYATLQYTPSIKRKRNPLGPSAGAYAQVPESLVARLMEDIERQIPNAEGLQLVATGGGPQCLTFSSRGHYCVIQGGDHTSNHVYYVCWLDTCLFYQRCFNARCISSVEQQYPAAGGNAAGTADVRRTARGPIYNLNPLLFGEISTYLHANGLEFLNVFDTGASSHIGHNREILEQPDAKRAFLEGALLEDDHCSLEASMSRFKTEMLKDLDALLGM